MDIRTKALTDRIAMLMKHLHDNKKFGEALELVEGSSFFLAPSSMCLGFNECLDRIERDPEQIRIVREENGVKTDVTDDYFDETFWFCVYRICEAWDAWRCPNGKRRISLQDGTYIVEFEVRTWKYVIYHHGEPCTHMVDNNVLMSALFALFELTEKDQFPYETV